MRPTPRLSLLACALVAGTTAWSAAAEPAMAYIDPTAAGAFLQSMYVIMASLVLFVAALPHKVAEAVRAVKAKFTGKAPEAPVATTAAPDQET